MCGGPVTDEEGECPHCGESLRFDPQKLDLDVDRKSIRRFHAEVRGLVLFWIVTGLLSIAAGCWLLDSGTTEMIVYTSRLFVGITATVLIISGAVWMWCGVMTARKNFQAVRIGLWISYLNVLINLTFLNIFGIGILFVGIMQALRVLKNGLSLEAAGLLKDKRV
jgi:hypothetical protein